MKIQFVKQDRALQTRSKKIDKYIEIVASSNPRLNAMAEDSQLTIQSTLAKRYCKVHISIVDNIDDLERLVVKKPDLVVLGMKLILLDPSKSYDDSPKIWLSNYLSAKGINFTGSDTGALMLEFDKQKAKDKVIEAGLQSSAYFISRIDQPTFKHNLRFPLFVKPNNRGDSKGIDERSIVSSNAELESKILSIHNDYASDALVEEYLPGREFSVAIVQTSDPDELLEMPIEISAPADKMGNRFLSEEIKVSDSEEVLPVTSPQLRHAINTLAVGVFKALGARDYGRIDMRLDGLGAPNFIEANLMPGLSSHGYLARCFYINKAVTYDDMILLIVEQSFKRISDLQPIKAAIRLNSNIGEIVSPELASTGIVI